MRAGRHRAPPRPTLRRSRRPTARRPPRRSGDPADAPPEIVGQRSEEPRHGPPEAPIRHERSHHRPHPHLGVSPRDRREPLRGRGRKLAEQVVAGGDAVSHHLRRGEPRGQRLVAELNAFPATGRRVEEELEGPAIAESLGKGGVAVGVGIDETGKDQPVGRVHLDRVLGRVHARGADGTNRGLLDQEVGMVAAPPVSIEHAAAPDDQTSPAHRRIRSAAQGATLRPAAGGLPRAAESGIAPLARAGEPPPANGVSSSVRCMVWNAHTGSPAISPRVSSSRFATPSSIIRGRRLRRGRRMRSGRASGARLPANRAGGPVPQRVPHLHTGKPLRR